MTADQNPRSVTYGVGTRLAEPPSSEMLDYFEQVYLDGADDHYVRASIAVSLAHVVMLAETAIIPMEDAAQILAELLTLESAGISGFPLDRRLGDPLPNLENHLISRLGDSVGGRFHTGRSRGDYYVALSRLKFRRLCLELAEQLLLLRATVLLVARQHVESVMPGYTHLQHAQPITLAHYLLSVIHQLERDHARLLSAFHEINQSPLGIGILATTSFPLDRDRTASLLGFDGLVRNGRDMVDRDHVLQLTSAAAVVMIHMHKFASDLYEWATVEFGFVRVADQDAMTSSMMPQKANPVLLELVRVRTANVIGSMVGTFAMAKIASGNQVEGGMVDAPALQAVKETIRAVTRFRPVVERITFDTDRMAEAAGRHWSQATDLADLLVKESGISFREAHRVIGRLVATSLNKGIDPLNVTAELLAQTAEQVLGRPLVVSQTILSKALDPHEGVAARRLLGGPAPQVVRPALESAADRLAVDQAEVQVIQRRLEDRQRELIRAARAMTIRPDAGPRATTQLQPTSQ